jgi:predicted Zn-dependent protease
VTISGTSGQAEFSGGPYDGNMRSYIAAVFQAKAGQNANLDFGDVRSTDINGLNMSTASASANTQSGQVTVSVYAYEFGPKSAFHFLTIVPAGTSADPFASMVRSMRRLSAQEASAIKARHVEVISVRSGDTVASLASRMAYADFREDRFRVLNAIPADATLKPGQKVKLIVY